MCRVRRMPWGGERCSCWCGRGVGAAFLPPARWVSAIRRCPAPDDMLAVAGGYAYLVNTTTPERCVHLPLRPVTQIVSAVDEGLILLAGFHTVAAVGAAGLLWETGKLSWEGVKLGEVRDGK